MSFQVRLTRYQVETASNQFHSPHKAQAETEYQRLVRENIPCEFYKDGIVQKEFKPRINI